MGGSGCLPALLLGALLLATLPAARAAAGKCLHCLAVGAELQRRLDNEVPRNHLDMRHRLDSQGQRYGKVIDYKVSELRLVELLDDLCPTMKQYDLMYLSGNETDAGLTGWNWIKARGDGSQPKVKSKYTVSKQEMKSRQNDLEGYCGRVMEDHDERLSDAITGGELERQTVTHLLCFETLKVCKAEESAADAKDGGGDAATDGDGAKEEL